MSLILPETEATAVADTLSLDGEMIRRLAPHRQYMMLLDCVTRYDSERRAVIGIRNIAQNDAVVQSHFPDRPCFPGSLLIEALAQCSGLLMNLEYLRRKGIGAASFADPRFREMPLEIPMTVLVESKIQHKAVAVPGDQVQLHARVVLLHGDMGHFHVSARLGEREIAHGEIMLAYAPYMS